MFFVSMNDYIYDQFFCAYKYYTLIWKSILRKFWNINQLTLLPKWGAIY
jgi:hypothetical protein